ncbi:hypothetical protein D3C84_1060600 [compost metagenome]
MFRSNRPWFDMNAINNFILQMPGFNRHRRDFCRCYSFLSDLARRDAFFLNVSSGNGFIGNMVAMNRMQVDLLLTNCTFSNMAGGNNLFLQVCR